MLAKLGCYIKELLSDLKSNISENKYHFYLIVGSFALGVLAALAVDYSSVDSTSNFVYVMVGGSTSPLPEFFRILIVFAAVYGALFFSTVTIYSFYAAVYVGPGITSYIFFRRAFGAIAVQSATGLIYLCLFVVPMLAVGLICFTVLTVEIKPIVLSSGRGKSRLPLKCNAAALWSKFKPILFLNLTVTLIYWLIFYLILLLFVK